jgi:hypothetical protein
VHITTPRILEAGADGPDVAGLPWLARLQLRRMAVLVGDVT